MPEPKSQRFLRSPSGVRRGEWEANDRGREQDPGHELDALKATSCSTDLVRCTGPFGAASLQQSRELYLQNGKWMFQPMSDPVPLERNSLHSVYVKLSSEEDDKYYLSALMSPTILTNI